MKHKIFNLFTKFKSFGSMFFLRCLKSTVTCNDFRDPFSLVSLGGTSGWALTGQSEPSMVNSSVTFVTFWAFFCLLGPIILLIKV